jgi:hypothetical protein
VAFLPTTAAACSLTQTLCPGLLQSVTAWWLAAVATVLGQLISQLLDLDRLGSHCPLQFANLLLQRQDDRYEGIFVQLFELAAIKV